MTDEIRLLYVYNAQSLKIPLKHTEVSAILKYIQILIGGLSGEFSKRKSCFYNMHHSP